MKNILIGILLLFSLQGVAQSYTISSNTQTSTNKEIIRVTSYKNTYTGVKKVIIKLEISESTYTSGYVMKVVEYNDETFGWTSTTASVSKSDIRGYDYKAYIGTMWHYFNLPNGY